MSSGKGTVCSLCHGEIGPDVFGRMMCYGCGPDELKPPERRNPRSPDPPRKLPPAPEVQFLPRPH